jgi:hypothetical protein
VRALFQKGYIEGSVHRDEADRLLSLLKKQSFFEGGNYREDPSLPPPQVLTQAPAELFEECRSWSNYSALIGVQSLFGPFSYWFCTANRFTGGRGMMWHNDHVDASFSTVLIYLTEEDWKEDFGGCLEVGKISDASRMIEPRLNSNESGMVQTIGRIIPRHGTTVILNNLGLPFCHRVTPIEPNKTRYTLMFHFGYWENTRNARKDFGFNGVEGRSPSEGS